MTADAGGRTRFHPEAIEHLQRTSARPFLDAGSAPDTGVPPELRHLDRVLGAGNPDKGEPRGGGEVSSPAERMLVGLGGEGVPLVAVLSGSASGSEVMLGTWADVPGTTSGGAASRHGTLAAVLRGVHPGVDLVDAGWSPRRWPRAGLVLGCPTPAPPGTDDGAVATDRLLEAMAGADWTVMVLAEPLGADRLVALRRTVLEELRVTTTMQHDSRAPDALLSHYTDLLADVARVPAEGQAVGAWRTAVYLLGTEAGFPALAAAWRAIHSGQGSRSQPLRVFEDPSAGTLAARWAMPDVPGPPGPARYTHPFAMQSVLTSSQLAAYVELPRLESPGFWVRREARFDTVPPEVQPGEPSLGVGVVHHRAGPTTGAYRLPLAALPRHVLVAGMTGAGKTNTLLHLLAQVAEAGVPFLVVEPVKSEYRALLDHPVIGSRVQVLTVGDERTAPLRLNPFEVPAGVSVGEHLALVRAAFATAFGMWTPLPQVLDRCLREIYEDRGWDLRSGRNGGLAPGDDAGPAWPTLGDLARKVDDVVPRLGYGDRVAADLRAALRTRIDGLRDGGSGAMLDTERSVPMSTLLGAPTVLELQSLGDDDDRAFVMALLLIRVAEHRRAARVGDGRLAHVLVVEEAHRLLAARSAAGGGQEWSADPRGHAVEAFANLLAEVRAYGQGVVLADQVPTQLAAGAVKNTGTKIVHRLVASDDRAVVAGSTAMTGAQSLALATLPPGRAAVFGGGDDAPVLVQVPLVVPMARPGEEQVAARARAWRKQDSVASAFVRSHLCVRDCVESPDTCDAARALVDDDVVRRAVDRTVLSAVEDPRALGRRWPDIVDAVRARRRPPVPLWTLLRSVSAHGAEQYVRARAARYAWSYAAQAQLGLALRAALLEQADRPDDAGPVPDDAPMAAAFSREATRLLQRDASPYPACDDVCGTDPPACLYRTDAAALVASGRYAAAWARARGGDEAPEVRLGRAWAMCRTAGFDLVEYPLPDWPPVDRRSRAASARRACLCFAQQMVVSEGGQPETTRHVVTGLLLQSRAAATGAARRPSPREESGG